MDRTVEGFIKRKKYLQEVLKKIDTKYPKFPEETIYIARRKSGPSYYIRRNQIDPTKKRKNIYLKKSETTLIRQLMQKSYIEKLRRSICAELSAIEAYLALVPKLLPEEVFDNQAEERRLVVTPEIMDNRQFLKIWSESKIEAPELDIGNRPFVTEQGESVRSKAEYMIANMLFRNGITYIYEKPLKCWNKNIYPDFTLADAVNRREIYLEHFGMMDKQEYVENAIRKIADYGRAGIYLGDRLLLTMETSTQPVDIQAAEKMVLRALAAQAA